MDPGEGKILLRRTNEAAGSIEVDGDDADNDGDDADVLATADDENGLDPENPRGQDLGIVKERRWSAEVADPGTASVDSGCC